MKIECQCGETICDPTDSLPCKAHFIPDQDWFDLCDRVKAAVTPTGLSQVRTEAAFRELWTFISNVSRLAWQCRECGRVYVDDRENVLREFLPASDDVPRELFRSRPSPERPS